MSATRGSPVGRTLARDELRHLRLDPREAHLERSARRHRRRQLDLRARRRRRQAVDRRAARDSRGRGAWRPCRRPRPRRRRGSRRARRSRPGAARRPGRSPCARRRREGRRTETRGAGASASPRRRNTARRWPIRWSTPTSGLPGGPREALGRLHADEQRADEPGPVGHRDAVDVGERDARARERLADHGADAAQVIPRRELRDDAAVRRVQRDLRVHDVAARRGLRRPRRPHPSRRTTTRCLVRAWPVLSRQIEDREEVRSPALDEVPPSTARAGAPRSKRTSTSPGLHERDDDEHVVAGRPASRRRRGSSGAPRRTSSVDSGSCQICGMGRSGVVLNMPVVRRDRAGRVLQVVGVERQAEARLRRQTREDERARSRPCPRSGRRRSSRSPTGPCTPPGTVRRRRGPVSDETHAASVGQLRGRHVPLRSTGPARSRGLADARLGIASRPGAAATTRAAAGSNEASASSAACRTSAYASFAAASARCGPALCAPAAPSAPEGLRGEDAQRPALVRGEDLPRGRRRRARRPGRRARPGAARRPPRSRPAAPPRSSPASAATTASVAASSAERATRTMALVRMAGSGFRASGTTLGSSAAAMARAALGRGPGLSRSNERQKAPPVRCRARRPPRVARGPESRSAASAARWMGSAKSTSAAPRAASDALRGASPSRSASTSSAPVGCRVERVGRGDIEPAGVRSPTREHRERRHRGVGERLGRSRDRASRRRSRRTRRRPSPGRPRASSPAPSRPRRAPSARAPRGPCAAVACRPSSAISTSDRRQGLRVELPERVRRGRARQRSRVDRARDLRDLAVADAASCALPRPRTASARIGAVPVCATRRRTGRPRASAMRARPHTAATPTASAAPDGSPRVLREEQRLVPGNERRVRERPARDHRAQRGAPAPRSPSRTRTAGAPRSGSARTRARRSRCAAGSRRDRPARRAAA